MNKIVTTSISRKTDAEINRKIQNNSKFSQIIKEIIQDRRDPKNNAKQ
jgi:hypothetical protein